MKALRPRVFHWMRAPLGGPTCLCRGGRKLKKAKQLRQHYAEHIEDFNEDAKLAASKKASTTAASSIDAGQKATQATGHTTQGDLPPPDKLAKTG